MNVEFLDIFQKYLEKTAKYNMFLFFFLLLIRS